MKAYSIKISLKISCLLLMILCVNELKAQCVLNHSVDVTDNWKSCQAATNPNAVRGSGHWIEYDFGQNYMLGTTHIWNYNVANNTTMGFKDVVIDYSVDGINWIEWGTHQFLQASGTIGETGFAGPDLSGVTAQYVVITALNNWGSNCYGLGEVRFDVESGINVELKVFLEGPYAGNNTMNTELNASGVLPFNQPYNVAPYHYVGAEMLAVIPSNMVDWVLVEARQGTPNLSGNRGTVTVETKAGILLENGDIVGIDGLPLSFQSLVAGQSYYFCIRHRNHLDVLTATPLTLTDQNSYDFTTNQAFGTGQQKQLSDGKLALFAGDYTQDGVIQITDYDIWKLNSALLNVYLPFDGNLDATSQTTDYDTWFLNKAKLGIAEIAY